MRMNHPCSKNLTMTSRSLTMMTSRRCNKHRVLECVVGSMIFVTTLSVLSRGSTHTTGLQFDGQSYLRSATALDTISALTIDFWIESDNINQQTAFFIVVKIRRPASDWR